MQEMCFALKSTNCWMPDKIFSSKKKYGNHKPLCNHPHKFFLEVEKPVKELWLRLPSPSPRDYLDMRL